MFGEREEWAEYHLEEVEEMDSWAWPNDVNIGEFALRSMKKVFFFDSAWILKKKVNIFTWKVGFDRLPTFTALRRTRIRSYEGFVTSKMNTCLLLVLLVSNWCGVKGHRHISEDLEYIVVKAAHLEGSREKVVQFTIRHFPVYGVPSGLAAEIRNQSSSLDLFIEMYVINAL